MKYILVAISGAADQPDEELGGKTPFEVAKIPNLHHFAKIGKVGQLKLTAEHLEPSGDVTFFNLLGYDAENNYTGLGPLEAANFELKLEEDEIPFRMNFITESGGALADPTAGQVTTKEAKALINFLNKKVASDFVRFFAGGGYRHLAVIKDAHGFEALSAKTVSPHRIIGKSIEDYLPQGAGAELLKKLMYDARLLLQDHEINQVRVDLGENPANMVWLWGQGKSTKLDRFADLFGLPGAVITQAGYAKGVARLAGLTVMEVGKESDDPVVNFERKAKLLEGALEDKDFVCVHLRACELAGREGDLREKISSLEGIDYYILSRIKKYIEQNRDTRVLITPCHATPWRKQASVRESVPFVIAGKNVMPDDNERFSELTAQTTDLQIGKGADLMSSFLTK